MLYSRTMEKRLRSVTFLNMVAKKCDITISPNVLTNPETMNQIHFFTFFLFTEVKVWGLKSLSLPFFTDFVNCSRMGNKEWVYTVKGCVIVADERHLQYWGQSLLVTITQLFYSVNPLLITQSIHQQTF